MVPCSEKAEEDAKFITDQVKDANEALQGARDIIAEWISEHEQARNKVRQLFTESAVVYSKVLSSKKEEAEAQKYRDYFEFSEPLSQSPSHRVLTIRRGEKEGYLSVYGVPPCPSQTLMSPYPDLKFGLLAAEKL